MALLVALLVVLLLLVVVCIGVCYAVVVFVFGGSFGSRLPWVVGDAWLARTVSNVIAEGLAA